MKKTLFILSLTIIIPLNAFAGFENDYIWQERFDIILAQARTGDAKAEYSLGEMYEKGRGTHKDLDNALEWYKRSASKSHAPALYKLGYFHFTGVGVQKDFNKAYEYFQKPANKGNTRAQFYLAKLYDQGMGVSRDRQEALVWFSRSSLGGYIPAREELQNIKKEIEENQAKEKQQSSVNVAKNTAPKVKVASVKNKITTAPVVIKPETPVVTSESIIENLLKGGWVRGNRPADFLPSDITKCHAMHSTLIECLSTDLKRKVGNANIIYNTKALIYGIKTTGSFEVAYRNNILKIDRPENSDNTENNPTKLPLKLGWQETEHQLVCTLDNTDQTKCLKNKVRSLTYKRNKL